MPSKQIVFALVTFLHDLFTAVWIGGLVTLALSVLPSARAVLGRFRAIGRRLRFRSRGTDWARTASQADYADFKGEPIVSPTGPPACTR